MILAQSSGINSVSLCNWFHNLSRLQRQNVAQHLWRCETRPFGPRDDLIREIKALKTPSPSWLRAATVQFPRVVICTWPSFPTQHRAALLGATRFLVWFGFLILYLRWREQAIASKKEPSRPPGLIFFSPVLWNTCFCTGLLTMTFFFATCILSYSLKWFKSLWIIS